MLKSLITCSILFYSWSILNAQQSSSDSPGNHQRKWAFGLSGSIDYCNRWLYDIEKSEFSESYIRIFNDLEIGKPGYTIGVAIEIPVNKKTNLNTGLLFAHKGYQTKWRDAQWPDPTQPGSFTAFKSITTIYHLDIPLVLQTYFNPTTKKWFLRYGLTTNIFLQENYTQVVEENGQKDRTTRKETHDFNNFNLSTEIGFGKQIKMNQTMNLQLVPVFRYGLFATADASVATHLWSLGLNMVCYWRRSSAKEM